MHWPRGVLCCAVAVAAARSHCRLGWAGLGWLAGWLAPSSHWAVLWWSSLCHLAPGCASPVPWRLPADMTVRPGRHHGGTPRHTANVSVHDPVEALRQAVAVPLEPGDALLFHGDLIHGTPPNRTSRYARTVRLVVP